MYNVEHNNERYVFAVEITFSVLYRVRERMDRMRYMIMRSIIA